MKSKLLLIVLLFEFLTALDTLALSQRLKPILCQKESIRTCNMSSYLIPIKNRYIMLDNNKVLVFFKLFNKSATHDVYLYGTQNGIAIFGLNNSFEVPNRVLSGDIGVIKRDPYGGIWVSHPWNIEGTTPALSYTLDGKKWQDISFPTQRPTASIEWLNICLLPNDITLKFKGEGIKDTHWITSYRDALSYNPKWKLISKQEYNSNHCLNADAIYNNWKVVSSKKNLSFSNGSKLLVIPNKIPLKSDLLNKYSIQVGHFQLKENLDKVSRELNEIIGYPLITKELSTNSYKLFLGTFNSPQEAREALERLKRRYKKNRYINEAFVVRL